MSQDLNVIFTSFASLIDPRLERTRRHELLDFIFDARALQSRCFIGLRVEPQSTEMVLFGRLLNHFQDSCGFDEFRGGKQAAKLVVRQRPAKKPEAGPLFDWRCVADIFASSTREILGQLSNTAFRK